MSPLLKHQFNGEELSVANIVVSIIEGTWMESGWSPLLLRQYRSNTSGRGIDFDNKWFVRIRVNEERCAAKGILESMKSFCGRWGPG